MLTDKMNDLMKPRAKSGRPLSQWFLAVALLTGAITSQSARGAGWTQYTNPNPAGGTGVSILLSDGTIMVVGGNGQSWVKLTPDSTGSYANGTWSNLASMGTARLYFGSNLMTNGKVFVLGGEYSGPGLANNWINTGEIYDPVANSWSPIPNFPQSNFGDDPTVLLPNGKILCGYLSGSQTYLFDPSNNTWSQTGSKLRGDRSDEESWALLPDGTVLSYDIFASDSNNRGSAQKYDYRTGTWSDAGGFNAVLSTNTQGYELGPVMLLPDGRVIQVGGNENIAIYTPSSNTWAAGPSLPAGMGADDAPGALLPNGHFLFLADSYLFNAPTKMYDFNYANNTLTDITSTLPAGLQSDLASGPAYYRRMTITPDGHLMLGTGTNRFWDYAPTGAPLASWAPTVVGVTKGSGANANVYTLTGTRLTGISQGSSYGDDVESDSNIPLVRLTGPLPSSTVKFARTTNWTPGVSSAGSTTQSSVQFTLPSGMVNGTYNLAVVANGIASQNFTFTYPYTNSTSSNTNVTTSFGGNTLNVLGDAGANSISITQRGTQLVVQGAGSTLINNTTSATYNITGPLTILCNFNQTGTPATNDSVTFVSVNATNISLTFATGNDTANLTYCTVNTLDMNGGAGTDNLVLVGSKINTKNLSSVP